MSLDDEDPVEKEKSSDDIFDDDLDFDDDFDDSKAPMEAKSDLLKQLTDFDPFLQTKVCDWLGMTWNQEAKDYVSKKGVIPTMNIHGASKCITFLRTYARNNNILTQLTIQQY